MLKAEDLPDFVEASLDFDSKPATFALSGNRSHVHKAKARHKRSKRGLKHLINPSNAVPILSMLPQEPDDRTHVTLRGDFVLCDLIPLILQSRGFCPHLRIATLGMSADNANTLAQLQSEGKVGDITLAASDYFKAVDSATTFRSVQAILSGRARFITLRTHAKVILIPTSSGDYLVIEGSANLRSSGNIEQIVIVNDKATHDHHASWIDELEPSA
jgi:hypothetical protein